MKKLFVLFAVMAVSFCVSENLHSSTDGIENNSREIVVYCAYQWYGACKYAITGDACYLVDEECNWIDEPVQPGDPE